MTCARKASSHACCGGAATHSKRRAHDSPRWSRTRARGGRRATPFLAEVEKSIPRPARQEFSLFMWAGWLDAKLVELPSEHAANAVTRGRFAEQWAETNPRFRGAHAVATYLEREGIAPLSAGGTVYSDEREILDQERDDWRPRVAVHFGAKLLQWAMFDFGQGTPRALVVLNPTSRTQTLRALDMRAMVDRHEFFEFQYRDGRLKLIERLSAAYRAGELPDYMLEFVDSLRARPKSRTT